MIKLQQLESVDVAQEHRLEIAPLLKFKDKLHQALIGLCSDVFIHSVDVWIDSMLVSYVCLGEEPN